MLALGYHHSVPRHVAARFSPRTGMGALRLRTDVDPPRLPGPGWQLVRPRLSGICGSDQALVNGSASPYLASLTSTPFVPGHEVVGEVRIGDGSHPPRTRRVVVEPALEGAARADERTHLSAGLQIGYCRDTGGGWSEGLVAPSAQLHTVPDALTDEDAVLVEPLACSLHAVRIAAPEPGQRVAVIGAGTIGLLTIAALRELAPDVTVLAVAKHDGQRSEAMRMGADHTCTPDRLHLEAARFTGARRLVGRISGELLLGGCDGVLDCVGSSASLQAAVSATRPRGVVTLVGMPGQVSVDLALAWQRELQLRGAYGYGEDFPLALKLAERLRPGRLVDRGFHLRDFKAALEHAPRAARSGRVKTVFDLRNEG
jgi:threonine dehydrogenase-like Zn-dependent dehydrogenase